MLNNFYAKFHVTNNLKFKDNQLVLINLPLAIFPVGLFKEIALSEDDEMHRKIYELIKNSCKDFAGKFKKEHGFNDKQIRNFLMDLFTNSGFGKIELVRQDDEKRLYEISVQNNPFAEQVRFKSKKPVDHIMRGILAGVMSVYTEQDIDCVETNCVGVNKNYCTFIAKKRKDFDFKTALVADQLGK